MVDTPDYDKDYDKIYGGKYLGHADLEGGEPHLKISKVEIVKLPDKNGTEKLKFVASFEGAEKSLVINKTNAKKLAEAYGKQRDKWIGQTVQLYVEDTNFGPGIRMRTMRKPPTVGQPTGQPDSGPGGDAIPF